MHYYGPPADGGCGWMNQMLAKAPYLEVFDSYKLRVGPLLRFAGNHLRLIRLARAELLDSCDVYAPNLQALSFWACYNFNGTFTLRESHPNFARPAGRPSCFIVDTSNACLSDDIVRVFESNPRIQWEPYGEEGPSNSSSMEAMIGILVRRM